jgi:cyclopropane-fatty-acyl-phospholipid synthase
MEPDFYTRHETRGHRLYQTQPFSTSWLPPQRGAVKRSSGGSLSRTRTDSGTIERRASERHAIEVAQKIVSEIFGPPNTRDFAVRYWNGVDDQADTGRSAPYTLVLTHPCALRNMFLPPSETRLAEAFLRNDFDIEGDIEGATELAWLLGERFSSTRRVVKACSLLMQLPRNPAAMTDVSESSSSGRWRLLRELANGLRHARKRDSMAIKHHYDVGNEFYSLWLDEHLAYSCAYFPTGKEDLDRAQEAKFDLICRKLRLQPGERLLDIGCGWGGLIRYAARNYGVTALGITISEAQAAHARERITLEGLRDRCVVETRDYRDLQNTEAFDKVVSVGMFEHVGRSKLKGYFAVAANLLRPGGLFLNHGIISLDDARGTHGDAAPPPRLRGKGRFIDRYVFPDGELVPLATAIGAGEYAGLETRDVESLREHYAETLRHWVRRLEQHSKEACELVGETRYRVWRLYMAASAYAFDTARIGVVQMLFARPASNGRCDHPRSRADIYS